MFVFLFTGALQYYKKTIFILLKHICYATGIHTFIFCMLEILIQQ